MTSADHERAGGFRGAINDMLGRDDHHDRDADDRGPDARDTEVRDTEVRDTDMRDTDMRVNNPDHLEPDHLEPTQRADTHEDVGAPAGAYAADPMPDLDLDPARASSPGPIAQGTPAGVPAAARLDTPPPGHFDDPLDRSRGEGVQTLDDHARDAQVDVGPDAIHRRSDVPSRPASSPAGPATDPSPAGPTDAQPDPTPAATTGGPDETGRERLVSSERAHSYSARWDQVKGAFVDEPRRAVTEADSLVGELLGELQTLFTDQRQGLEHGLDTDDTTTEDLRLALRRYRSFFDRLLSI